MIQNVTEKEIKNLPKILSILTMNLASVIGQRFIVSRLDTELFIL